MIDLRKCRIYTLVFPLHIVRSIIVLLTSANATKVTQVLISSVALAVHFTPQINSYYFDDSAQIVRFRVSKIDF